MICSRSHMFFIIGHNFVIFTGKAFVLFICLNFLSVFYLSLFGKIWVVNSITWKVSFWKEQGRTLVWTKSKISYYIIIKFYFLYQTILLVVSKINKGSALLAMLHQVQSIMSWSNPVRGHNISEKLSELSYMLIDHCRYQCRSDKI